MKPSERLPVSQVFSPERYYDPEFFKDELQYLFRTQWLNVGHVCDIPNPGDYLVCDLHALGASALIIRGKDNQLRAFYNMCTHRGNKVIMTHCNAHGHAKAFTCLFHGWVFDLNGKLVGVPGKEYFGDLDVSNRNLYEMRCDTWGGMIFINLAEKPEYTLAEYLEPLTGKGLGNYLDGISWRKAFGWSALINTNWKLICDAQLEGYHVASLHGNSIAGAIPCENLVPKLYENPKAVPGIVSAYLDLQAAKPTPIQLISAKYGISGTYVRSKLDNMKLANPNAFNEEQRPDWQFDNYALLPHGVMFVQGSGYAIQRSWPVAPDKTFFEMDVYLPVVLSNFGEVFNEYVNEYNLRDVITEDLATLEHTQANLAEGPVKDIVFSAQEGILSAFHSLIDQTIQRYKHNQ